MNAEFRAAKQWVHLNFEGGGPVWSDWSGSDYWDFIEEFHVGGIEGFLASIR